ILAEQYVVVYFVGSEEPGAHPELLCAERGVAVRPTVRDTGRASRRLLYVRSEQSECDLPASQCGLERHQLPRQSQPDRKAELSEGPRRLGRDWTRAAVVCGGQRVLGESRLRHGG